MHSLNGATIRLTCFYIVALGAVLELVGCGSAYSGSSSTPCGASSCPGPGSSSSSGGSSSSSGGGVTSGLNGTYMDSSTSYRAFVTFFSDGYYAYARRGPGTDGCAANYTEFGSFTLASTTVFSASILIASDTTKCGIGGVVNDITASGSGSSISLVAYTTSSSRTFTPVTDGGMGSSSLIGSFHDEEYSCGTGTHTTGTTPNSGNTQGKTCSGLLLTSTAANVDIITFLDASHAFRVSFDTNSPPGGGIDDLCYTSSTTQISFTTTNCTVDGGVYAAEAMSSNSFNGLTLNGVTVSSGSSSSGSSSSGSSSSGSSSSGSSSSGSSSGGSSISNLFPSSAAADKTGAGDWFQYTITYSASSYSFTDSSDRILPGAP